MSNLEAVGWMALCTIELSEFDVQYRSRTAIKGQVVTDKCNFYMIFIILLFIKIVSFPLFLLI